MLDLAPQCDVLIVVDVLSFSTCVDIAVSNGAIIYPSEDDGSELQHAQSIGGIAAQRKRTATDGYSLSPVSLRGIPSGTRLVLPSVNGSALSTQAGSVPTFTGCLRNALAVAHAAQKLGRRIGVVPTGEKWDDGTLRPAIEDILGAGAVIEHLPGKRSSEAEIAKAAFRRYREELAECLRRCRSGKELIVMGFGDDVELAAALDVSACAPILRDGAYRKFDRSG